MAFRRSAVRSRLAPPNSLPSSLLRYGRPAAGRRSLLVRRLRLERHGDAVDAVTQVRRGRAVVEDVAEVAAAVGAVAFRPHHPVAPVGSGFDAARHRFVEARPARAAFELHLGAEQRHPAPGAGKSAGTLLMQQGAAPRRLRTVAAHDAVLLRGQYLTPFGLAALKGEMLVHDVSFRWR